MILQKSTVVILFLALMFAGCGTKKMEADDPPPQSGDQTAKFHVMTVSFFSGQDVKQLVPSPKNSVSSGIALTCHLTLPEPIPIPGSSDREDSVSDGARVDGNAATLNLSLTEAEIQEGTYRVFCYVFDPIDAIKISLEARSVSVMKEHTQFFYDGTTTLTKGMVKDLLLSDENFFHAPG